MLQTKCRHSDALPEEACLFCNSAAPESLLDVCFSFINSHLETMCRNDPEGNILLRDGVALPVEICEKLLNLRCKGTSCVNSEFINIFKDRDNTRLKRVKIRGNDIADSDLEVLMQHRLTDLEISNCPQLSAESIRLFTAYGSNLQSLAIGDNTNIFPQNLFGKLKFPEQQYDKSFIFLAPSLRRLTIRNAFNLQTDFFMLLLAPLHNLTHLDLSNCGDLKYFHYTSHLSNLTSLVLYNVDVQYKIPAICNLTSLRHLDISQSKEAQGKFSSPNEVLASIIERLTRLTSLDISGTNLAGRGVAEAEMSSSASDIPGLIGRVANPFQFLGLYETSHDACLRHDIPAKFVAGNANEEQVLIAALAYLDRPEMLQKVLNELFHLFRFESCEFVGQALNIVLEAMTRHLDERHIQISGSATLFYIVKGTGKELHEAVRVKRKIITTLLNGMTEHKHDDTMMRNGCLTLCQFKIPADVLFEYDRLVDILLHSVHGMQQESFVQRIGIYLLNSLACQVDGHQKVKLGELGAITKMILLISDRLNRGLCDDVLEVAWSTMWNVTDETPSNCKKFLERHGMGYFLSCLQKFPDKDELLRNMMGLLGNVAEVPQLRHFLMTSEYLAVFTNLLGSQSDGIEVSYNAAGVISHIASDGPEVWTVEEPSREYVLQKMVQAIEWWDINSPRNINYRSFEPILYLVRVYHTPECQRWAVWALANLTKVYPEKYCALVEKEGGLLLLENLVNHDLPPMPVKELALIVIRNCISYKEQGLIDIDSDYPEAQLDG